MPRIIAGTAGSIPLKTPRGKRTRPTSDKAKEALFSMLTPHMPGSFLDLYAGSGQVGLEAASRGCQPVVLVEKDPSAIACIRKNIEKTRLDASVELVCGDVLRSVRAFGRQNRRFDLIFLDPPYAQAMDHFARLAAGLGRLLQPGGCLILEHEAGQDAAEVVTNLQLWKRCQHAVSMLSFYQLKQDE